MSARQSFNLADAEKGAKSDPVEPASGRQFSVDEHDVGIVEADEGKLHRNLQGRHMQMIAM
jgi:amino acid transporter